MVSLRGNISELIQQLKSSTFLDHPDDLKKMIFSLQQANKLDVQRLLETVNNDMDVDLQVKIFSVLSAYLLTNGLFQEIIVTFHPLYDRINEILNTCSPFKTTITLNFICSLLYNGEEDQNASRKRNLVIHSQNMLRYQDTWKALCRTLAECCSGSVPNQTYCSGLIGLCIQKCQEGHVETYTVLQSLLQNHPKNLKIFLDCNGSVIFSREFLQYDACMQVLNTIIQSSEEAVVQIRSSDVLSNLRELLNLYGPRSQIGQWATVILYYLDLQKKISGKNDKTLISRHEDDAKDYDTINNIAMPQNNPRSCNFNETDTLMQNIAREISSFRSQGTLNSLHWNPMKGNAPQANRQAARSLQTVKSPNIVNKLNTLTIQQSVRPSLNLQNNIPRTVEDTNEMSFSFIDKEIVKDAHDHPLLTSRCSVMSVDVRYKTKDSILSFSSMQQMSISPQETASLGENLCLSKIRYSKDFEPRFVSTPKKKVKRYRNPKKPQKSLSTHVSYEMNDANKRKSKHTSLVSMKQVKNRSMSSRFFDVINESCTTLVNTVTSIFRSKKQPEDSLQAASSLSGSEESCSYSFTNYMKRRDAMLPEEKNKRLKSSFNENKDACITCNDTLILKHKLDNDEQLRMTVKKIKMGINLYGCDFKKISRTMWPREKYMTPTVLYQLYRKLIANQR